MLRHTTHLATTLRPAQRRKKARTGAGDVVRGGRTSAPEARAGMDPSEAAAMHAAATSYPARERAAGGPQDNALYRCSCGAAFVAHVEAGVHCPRCDAEQNW